MPHNTPLLRVDVAEHRYHPLKQTLAACQFAVQRGEIVSLIGPSGCGKSTLLRVAADLIEATSGAVVCHASTKAVLFQEPRLLPWKDLLANIGFGLKGVKGLSPRKRQTRSLDIAQKLGFNSDDYSKLPHELSGGMKQRAALGRALALAPELLFLDEPFSALDIGRRRALYRLLLSEVDSQLTTMLLITHDISEALALSDRILVMAPEPGRIVKVYQPDIPREKRDRQAVSAMEDDFMSDPMMHQLFELENWQQLQ
ncbi:ABC transporter ATP-binding protein [Polycladidibacter stylochi]|uniref:ABC transporter ATP-binding protein n=1 Tax=Polycladidibacter stylochi TaxID=1807766 RepID=UPI00082CED44|nr:ATP-binding cassette domain-containing protein [Pseudovibrio stylochi]